MPQVLVVPLMGFMDNCHRIGYGGGFYDRSIEQLREFHRGQILTIGVAFDAQRFDNFISAEGTSERKEDENEKIAEMREQYRGALDTQIQLTTDQSLDYIITEREVYRKP